MNKWSFRVWIKAEKTMGMVEEILYDGQTIYVAVRFGINKIRLENGLVFAKFIKKCYIIGRFDKDPPVIIMQSLGFRDKYGQGAIIFEGDIVQLGDGRIVTCWFRKENHIFDSMEGVENFRRELEECGGEIVGNTSLLKKIK